MRLDYFSRFQVDTIDISNNNSASSTLTAAPIDSKYFLKILYSASISSNLAKIYPKYKKLKNLILYKTILWKDTGFVQKNVKIFFLSLKWFGCIKTMRIFLPLFAWITSYIMPKRVNGRCECCLNILSASLYPQKDKPRWRVS